MTIVSAIFIATGTSQSVQTAFACEKFHRSAYIKIHSADFADFTSGIVAHDRYNLHQTSSRYNDFLKVSNGLGSTANSRKNRLLEGVIHTCSR